MKDLFIFVGSGIKQISQAVHGSADLWPWPTQRLRGAWRRFSEYSRWQFTGISGWFASTNGSLKPPKSSLLGHVDAHFLHYHIHIQHQNLQILFLATIANFAMAKTCM